MYFTTALRSASKNSYVPVSKLARQLRHPAEGSAAVEPRKKGSNVKISHAGSDVHAVLDEFAAAHAAHDADGLFALYADGLFALYSHDVVSYSLGPPLQQGADTA